MTNGRRWLVAGTVALGAWSAGALAQQAAAPEPKEWTNAEDHQNMMDQLGIKALRPGPSGNEQAPNHANYDEATANPFPNLPDALTLKNGRKVTTAKMWWDQRRPEIVEDFDREVFGRVPASVPKVTWSAKKPVPVMIMFRGFGPPPQRQGGAPAPARGPAPPAAGGDPPATEQLLADGWGYVTLSPVSVQADNGAGLTKGIIGLVNKGQPRKPDDWGSLRAWAWGAARGLDYLETDSAVDAKRVGIEGVSRYGKAALITMAFEPRFAMVLVGSSGEGGAKLHRRNFGEAVENLTGSGEYHWMAGNFLKYGGPLTPGDLPVDAHELIALCAPRPTFISYGVPEKGDALWLDQQGSYMATVAAGPVFRLLGARDIGDHRDYKTAVMPPLNTGMVDGELAWRQHDGGHEDRSNMKHFIAWANKLIKHTPPSTK